MKRSKIVWMLVAVNALLLAGLAWKFTPENTAHAQAIARGELMMVPARLTGANNGVVYMLDTRNGLLTGFVYDNNRSALIPMEPILLNRVFEAEPGIGSGRQPPRRP